MTTTNVNVKKSKLLKDLEKFIDDKDRLHESFEIQFNGDDAHLVLTDKKLIVAEEIGLLRKTTKIRQIIPYMSVRNVTTDGNYKVILSVDNNVKHSLVIEKPMATMVENKIREYMKRRYT